MVKHDIYLLAGKRSQKGPLRGQCSSSTVIKSQDPFKYCSTIFSSWLPSWSLLYGTEWLLALQQPGPCSRREDGKTRLYLLVEIELLIRNPINLNLFPFIHSEPQGSLGNIVLEISTRWHDVLIRRKKRWMDGYWAGASNLYNQCPFCLLKLLSIDPLTVGYSMASLRRQISSRCFPLTSSLPWHSAPTGSLVSPPMWQWAPGSQGL